MIINIICSSSDHTVLLPESVRVHSVTLIEAMIPDSWYNLEEEGTLSWEGNSKQIKMEPGHYKLDDIKTAFTFAINDNAVQFLRKGIQNKTFIKILKNVVSVRYPTKLYRRRNSRFL